MIIIILILQMGRLRPRGVREPAQGHPADEGSELGFESSVAPELFSMIHHDIASAWSCLGGSCHGAWGATKAEREGSRFPNLIAYVEGK